MFAFELRMKTKSFLCLLLLMWSGGMVASGKTTRGGSAAVEAARNGSRLVNSESVFTLTDFGAVGDGVTDDGPALQNALNAIADAGGGTLFVPAGRYAIITPVQKDFSGLAASVTILGVESLTPIPPADSDGEAMTQGLDLTSEFAPKTGDQAVAINITGLRSFLIKDIGFIGTPDVFTDALVTLGLNDVDEAIVRHCEFYGLSSTVEGGAIVQSLRSRLHLEQSLFLGDAGDSSLGTSVVQNIEWKGITLVDTIFMDYGQRPELYGKLDFGTPFSWVSIGNAAQPGSDSPRREAVIRNVFFDEGAFIALSAIPYRYLPDSAPIDLVYVSGLYMNVSNLNASGHYLYGVDHLLIENSHYGYSHAADSAINLLSVGNAILDQVECGASSNRIRADAATGKLTVINSIYTYLDSESPATRVITTQAPEDDPVQYVRQQFNAVLGRDPDPAAHFFWSERMLQCDEDAQCIVGQRTTLLAYLNTQPSASFSISGRTTDESGAALPGVTVTLAGSQSVATQTSADGRYSFTELPTSGVYSVTADRPGYTFETTNPTITTPNGNQIVDFVSTALGHFRINGRVTNAAGAGLAGVNVTLSGSQSDTTTTNAFGDYGFSVAAEGDYTIAPSSANYTFSPAAQFFNDISFSQRADFTGALQSVVQFDATSYTVSEGTRTITVAVTRSGDTSAEAKVIYSATDGSATQRSDVIPVIGRLTFAPGETSKGFVVFITDDAHVEGDESLTLNLSDPVGGTLGANSTATLTIIDNDSAQAPTNPIDGAEFFVRQQYRDFLNRPPDDDGLAFWSNQISSCGSDQDCVADRRMNVSAAFFLSIEFQETGFFVYRLYQASFAQPPQHLDEFLLDTRTIGQGVVVNTPGWEQLLETKKAAFIADFVRRSQFSGGYAPSLTPDQFVNQLNSKAGGTLSSDEVAAAVAEFGGSALSDNIAARARVLRRVAESQTFTQRQLSPAFVLMQYFGYLQRNPNEAPDTNLDGYNFWLNKLDEFGGDFRRADMVKSFLLSAEYRSRFGAP